MGYADWNALKSKWLKTHRGMSFEDIMVYIEAGKVLDIILHPDQSNYPEQAMLIVDVNGTAYVVPFVRDGDKVFLKTLFPSRKRTKQYLRNKPDEPR